MIKLGILIIITTFQPTQASIVQDSTGIEELLREERIENQLLEREIEILEEHVKEIRNTVYWALGGVIGLVLIFAGANWLTQNKLFEREKNRFIKEFDEKLTSASEILKKDFQKEVYKLREVSYPVLSIISEFFSYSITGKRYSEALQQAHHFLKIYDEQECDHDLLLKDFLIKLSNLLTNVNNENLGNSVPEKVYLVIIDHIKLHLRSINKKMYQNENELIIKILQ